MNTYTPLTTSACSSAQYPAEGFLPPIGGRLLAKNVSRQLLVAAAAPVAACCSVVSSNTQALAKFGKSPGHLSSHCCNHKVYGTQQVLWSTQAWHVCVVEQAADFL